MDGGGLFASSFVGNFGFQVVLERHGELDAQAITAVLSPDSPPQFQAATPMSTGRSRSCQTPPPPAALLSTPERFQNCSIKARPTGGGRHGAMLMIAAGKGRRFEWSAGRGVQFTAV